MTQTLTFDSTMATRIIGGIEGGATKSVLILMDQNGKELVRVNGLGTNHYVIGMPECHKRINDMVSRAKQQAGIPETQPLYTLGLCLSGCEQEESNTKLWKVLKEQYPNISEHYTVGSDTDGSVATVAPNGGLVVIAGTGSNCLLINPDGGRFQCGGWGWLLSDEGSAFWISLQAVRLMFNDADGFHKSPFPTDVVWAAIQEHFHVESRPALLDHCYAHFEKHEFAGLCLRLVEGAENGDALCKYFFELAGEMLARMVLAHVPKAAPELVQREGGLQVLCVGSVWKSWELLKPGFVATVRKNCALKEFSLTRLTTTTAIGAAYLAASKLHFSIPTHFDSNHHVFYHYTK